MQSLTANHNTIGLPLIDDTLFIDNSTYETFTTCPRSAEYYFLQKKERNRDRSALKFGGILHKILETRYLHSGRVLDDKAKAEMLQAALRGFQDYCPEEGDHRNYDMAVDFILEYANAYPIESFDVVNINNRPAIELPFALPLFDYEINRTIPVRNPDGSIEVRYVGTIKIIWQGRTDLVIRQGDNNIYGLDHKSTSMMGPTYFKEFELSSQFSGYTWAMEQLLDTRLAGFIINGLGIRKPTKTGKKLEFQRYTINSTPSKIDEWKRNTIHNIGQFIENTITSFHPQNTKWCVGKYGACQFFDVCTLPIEQRQMMLATPDYKTVTWNPLTNED